MYEDTKQIKAQNSQHFVLSDDGEQSKQWWRGSFGPMSSAQKLKQGSVTSEGNPFAADEFQ